MPCLFFADVRCVSFAGHLRLEGSKGRPEHWLGLRLALMSLYIVRAYFMMHLVSLLTARPGLPRIWQVVLMLACAVLLISERLHERFCRDITVAIASVFVSF